MATLMPRAPDSDEDGVENSLFMDRLVEKVFQTLKDAQRLKHKAVVLATLFANLVLPIDERAKSTLAGADIPSDTAFFQILCVHYATHPLEGDQIIPLFSLLWIEPFTAEIFSLLLHRWLFESTVQHQDEIKIYTGALLSGSSDLFWMDVHGDQRRFAPLYDFLLNFVVLNRSNFRSVPSHFHRDLIILVFRFFFLYQEASDILKVLPSLPRSSSTFNDEFGSPADVFVTEVTEMLERLRVEPVLILYLSATRSLQGLSLNRTVRIRFQVVLLSMASQANAFFLTRPVRQCAREAVDWLFPEGRVLRNFVRFGFRLVRPIHWPGSLWRGINNIVHFVCQVILYLRTLVTSKLVGQTAHYSVD